jgi:hypothetical protein
MRQTALQSAFTFLTVVSFFECLFDGDLDASQIWQKNWATKLETVPLLHLVIPRTVGHIERHLSSSLSEMERMRTLIASLAQMCDEPENTPRPTQAGLMVANWLGEAQADPNLWPLSPVGSLKDITKYQKQRFLPTSPPSKRVKRGRSYVGHQAVKNIRRIRPSEIRVLKPALRRQQGD